MTSPIIHEICAPILEYLENATPEPEFVWQSGVVCLAGHPFYMGLSSEEDVAGVFPDEIIALCVRLKELAYPEFVEEVMAPARQYLPDALNDAKEEGLPLVLLDEEGREVRRWVL